MKTKVFFCLVLLALLLVLPLVPRGRAERSIVQPTGAFDVSVKGHVGGRPGVMLLDGTTAYVGLGGQVGILDISNPAAPVQVGQVILPTEVEDLALAGTTLFLAARYGGFYTVDVSDPAAPAVLAQGVNDLPAGLWAPTADIVRQVEVAGGYAYLLTGEDYYVTDPTETEQERMIVVDVTDPSNPTYANSLAWGGEVVNSLAIHGQYAYLLMKWSDGLHIVDLSDPAAPQEVQIDPDVVGARYVQAAGGRLVTYGGWNGIRIWDLADPLNPTEVGVLESFAEEIAVAGDRLFTLDYTSPLAVYEIGAPGELLVKLGEYETGVENYHLAVQGVYLYVTNENYELAVLDVSDPANIQLAGRLPTALPANGQAVFQNGYAYVPSLRGLEILSLADPLAPERVGEYVVDPDSPSYWQTSLAVSDGIAYLARNENPGITPGGLFIVDVSDPAQPALITSTVEVPNATQLALVGGYLYLSTATGLRIADVSDPAAPVFTGFSHPYLRFNDLKVAGSYAYLAGLSSANPVVTEDFNHRFVVLDITNPAQPVEVAALPVGMIEPIPHNVFLVGDQALMVYAASLGAYNRLETFDISNPAQPVSVSSYNPGDGIPWFTNDAELSGDTLLLADSYAGLRMLDVSDLTNPIPIGQFPVNRRFADNEALTVDVVGENIYLSVDPLGWYVLQYTGLSIGGRLLQPNGLPFAGPLVNLDAGQSALVDAQGNFLFDELPLGAYSVSPELAGFRFLPPEQTLDLPPSVRGVDFVALTAPQSLALSPGITGTLTFSDTQGLPTGLTFPAGAVSTTVTAVLTPTLVPLQGDVTSAGHAFELQVVGGAGELPDFSFQAPVSVTLSYSDWDVRSVIEEPQLQLLLWDGSVWQEPDCLGAPAQQVFPETNTLIAGICRPGLYALYGSAHTVLLPLVFGP